ncbi:MAG: tail fiber protein [Magnetococcus sp. DMHC-1]|nr:tail fiber protein [Magnetococcales bacterium]
MDDIFLGTVLPFAFNYAPRGWVLCTGQTLPMNQYTALYALVGNMYGGTANQTLGVPNLQGRTILGMGINGASQVQFKPGNSADSANMSGTTIAGNITLQPGNIPLPVHTHTATVGAITSTVTTQGYQAPSMQVAKVGSGTATQAPAAGSYMGPGDAGTEQVTIYYPASSPPSPSNMVNLGGFNPGTPGTVNVAISQPSVTINQTNPQQATQVPLQAVATVKIDKPAFYQVLNYCMAVQGLFPPRD